MKPGKKSKASTIISKQKFLTALALPNVFGLINRASAHTKISVMAHLHWMEVDSDYAAEVNRIRGMRKHFAENALHKLVEQGDPSCTSFVNRCLNREEYTPATDLKVSGDSEAPLTIKMDESAIKNAIENYYASNPDAKPPDKNPK